ncbi:acyl-CoA thioesterase [Neptunomonas concharum]|uniref:Thioesterase n=1 Tax=Neptunomonas concharum TaxID=1031538 RepID=A0A5P1R9F2_9GAMM|nr:thioesterase family protein [Neptunomonas concharum]QEQ95916.1 thioesterase [Neptunomonas concharum]
MARIKIEMPENYTFTTELPIRINDINYGGHLGNDAVLSMMHEARIRFLNYYHYTELDVEGAGIIMTDSAIVYRSEGFYGDTVKIDVTVGDFNRYGCDIYYLLTNKKTAAEIAQAKTGIVFFDYEQRKVIPVPEAFQASMQKEAG